MLSSALAQRLDAAIKSQAVDVDADVQRVNFGETPDVAMLGGGKIIIAYGIGELTGIDPFQTTLPRGSGQLVVAAPVWVAAYGGIILTNDDFGYVDQVADFTEGLAQYLYQSPSPLGMQDDPVAVPFANVQLQSGISEVEGSQYAHTRLQFVCQTLLPYVGANRLAPSANIPTQVQVNTRAAD